MPLTEPRIPPALVSTERLMRAVTDAIPSPMAYWDAGLICRFSNQRYLEWFGKTRAQMRGIHMRAMLGERLFGLNEPHILGALAGVAQEFEREIRKPDGTVGYTLVNYVPDIDAHGVVQGFAALVTNVTRLREADAAIRLSASVFDAASDGIIVTDVNRAIVSANPAVQRITGYCAQELLGQSPRMLGSERNGEQFADAVESALIRRGQWQGEQWSQRKDGSTVRLEVSVSAIRSDAGTVVRLVGLFSDITERHDNDERVRHLALHDALTDLPNRTLLVERLNQMTAMATRTPRHIAVLFIDLDGFKQVNDNWGHDAGDLVLKAVAQRLTALLRTVDTVARLGGDEFVVVLDNPVLQTDVAHIAQRIVTCVNAPIAVGQGERSTVQVGCSVGIALYPQHGTAAETLIKSADAAMYGTKAAGKNSFEFAP